MIIMGVFITVGFVWITLAASKFAMKLSAQTEKNFADAVRVMQGK